MADEKKLCAGHTMKDLCRDLAQVERVETLGAAAEKFGADWRMDYCVLGLDSLTAEAAVAKIEAKYAKLTKAEQAKA